MMMAACYESNNDNNKSDNKEDKVCLLLGRWNLVGRILDYMIIGFRTMMLQLPSFLVWALTNE